MIGFSLNDEQKQFQALARQFARDVIAPAAREHDRAETYPEEVIRQAHALGLLNIGIPETAGGLGLGMLDEVIIAEELAWGCMGIYTIMMASELGITPLVLAGTEEQHERFLTPLLDKPALAAFALSEADNGSDAAAMGARAEPVAGGFRLNGSKMWITNGGLADVTVVFATTDPALGTKGSVALLVEKDTPGFSHAKLTGKLGQRASYTAELVFEDVHVPEENLLGSVGDGFRIAMQTLDRTRIPVGAGSVGIARRALEESLAYAQERQAFGRPVSRFQAIQFKLADMKIQSDAARLQCWHAAWLVDQGLPHSQASAMAKTFASDIALSAASEAIQIHGGYGYMDEYPVEKLLRDVKLNQIYEGTNEIQRVVIARSLLR